MVTIKELEGAYTEILKIRKINATLVVIDKKFSFPKESFLWHIDRPKFLEPLLIN